jgi:hypothetical protein
MDPATMGGSLATPVSGAELLQAAQESVNAWMAACRADLRVVVAGTTSGTYDANDATNIIQWDNRTTAEGNYYGASTTTLAAATTVLNGTEFRDCDIVLNGNASTTMKFTPAMGEADLRSVLTHEIGHCLGLDHPIEPPTYTSADPFITGATMVQTAATGLDPSDPGRRTIAQDDRDGIECIYERGKPFRTGIHCGSYSGTNDGGAITGVVVGGPTVNDTACGGDAQGRNANPSVSSGDGCIPSALAATAKSGEKPANFSLARAVGGTWGFLVGVALLLALRFFRRKAALAGLMVLASVTTARAYDLELTFGPHKVSPDAWNNFAGMDPQATQWDRDPTAVHLGTISEVRAAAFNDPADWGKWGGSLTFTLPSTLETNAKALAASEQSKRTSLSGIRLGPEARWYPIADQTRARWFVGGRFGIGLLFGSQSFSSDSTAGQVSYRAWSTELALSTGAEIPLGPVALVLEGGYSRFRSSYFAATGNSGNAYSDFPSGTRLSTNTADGTEDVKFNGSGLFAAMGIQMTFGGSAPASEMPKSQEPESAPAVLPLPVDNAPMIPTEHPPLPPPPASNLGPDPVPEPAVPTEKPEFELNPPSDRPDPIPL